MKTIKRLKNSELTIEFQQSNNQTIVVTLRGNITSSMTNNLFDREQPDFDKLVFKAGSKLSRLIIDFREIDYINSMGAGILMRFHQHIKKLSVKLILVFETDSNIAFVMDTLGFFLSQKPHVVWDDLNKALIA